MPSKGLGDAMRRPIALNFDAVLLKRGKQAVSDALRPSAAKHGPHIDLVSFDVALCQMVARYLNVLCCGHCDALQGVVCFDNQAIAQWLRLCLDRKCSA